MVEVSQHACVCWGRAGGGGGGEKGLEDLG